MSGWAAKRFWKVTEVLELDGGFAIALDGRSVKTPAKAEMTLPTRSLAEKIAAEWDAQTEEIVPQNMPFTRCANAAIDKLSLQRAEVEEMLLEYGRTDLLCYRATAPETLIERQAQAWDPLLDWCAARFDARLFPTEGVIPIAQSEAAIDNLRPVIAKLSAFEMSAFHDLVTLSGSLVIGLAVLKGEETAESAWRKSRVDDIWQAEQWGDDEEAIAHATLKQAEFFRAEEMLKLIA